MEMKAGLRVLAALSHDGRLSVFRYLVRNADRDVCVGDIALALGMNGATLSFHLRELHAAHLLSRTRQGRQIYYRPRLSTVSELVEFLTEDCCDGRACDEGSGS